MGKAALDRLDVPDTYYVYMMRGCNGMLYSGFAKDVTERVAENNIGRGSKLMRDKRPFTLVATWTFESRIAAVRAEYPLRDLTQKQKFALVEGTLHPSQFSLKTKQQYLLEPRWIICEKCDNKRHAVQRYRDICSPCYKREPSSHCRQCGRSRRQIAEGTDLCIDCSARPVAECSHCLRERAIVNQKDWLCTNCNSTRKKKLQPEVKCPGCGRVKPPANLSTKFCKTCYEHGLSKIGVCQRCSKSKSIRVKSKGICRQCSQEVLATNSLRKYVAGFTTSYSYNKSLFDLLTSKITWDSVTAVIERRFRAFGRFLQKKPIKNPLSWEIIREALPPFNGTKGRNNIKFVRSCLIDCGHLLAARGEMESREAYSLRYYALLPIKSAPVSAQPILRRYTEWLEDERLCTMVNIRDHLEAILSFHTWCAARGIKLPEEVQPIHFNNYLVTLYEQWQCSKCEGTMPLDPDNRQVPQRCVHCDAIRSCVKVPRYTQHTVRKERAKLRVFFDWAKINRLVIINPIQRKVKVPDPTIQHYPPWVLEKLVADLQNPLTDPTEALVLYLIIFHGLSVWELQQAQLPAILSINKERESPALAKAYCVIVPRHKVSYGRRTPTRPSIQIDFPLEFAEWLEPLLERYDRERQQKTKNRENRYLLVANRSHVRNAPTCAAYILAIVNQASARILNKHVNPSLLRKTAGVIFTDCGNKTDLKQMGWGPQQAWGYVWHNLIEVSPMPAKLKRK